MKRSVPFFMQREEEEAKERAEAEKIKQEREMLAQKEEADRQVRKKVTRQRRYYYTDIFDKGLFRNNN